MRNFVEDTRWPLHWGLRSDTGHQSVQTQAVFIRQYLLYISVPSRPVQRHTQRRVDSSWNMMAHGDELAGKWKGNWRMEWVACTNHTTPEHSVPSITTADAQTSAASRRLNWRPRRFKWTRPFRRKTKSDFCACAITFQLASKIGTGSIPTIKRPEQVVNGLEEQLGLPCTEGDLYLFNICST
jgi:hypothetical protein